MRSRKQTRNDKNYSEFQDHQLSADPSEMKALVESIRHIESMFCRGASVIQKCEQSNVKALRRSVAAARDLPIGHIVKWIDLCWLRPQIGIKPGQEDMICGYKLTKDISHGEAFTACHFK